MGYYFPPDGGPTHHADTLGGQSIDALTAPVLREALRAAWRREAMLTREMFGMPCQCEKPEPYTRPSGTVICVNDHCGGKIEAVAVKKEKP